VAGDLVGELDTAKLYLWDGASLRYIHPGVATSLGIGSQTKWATGAGLSQRAVGANVEAYTTSWYYGGTDHQITTTAEAQEAVAAILASGADPNVSEVRNGVALNERFLVDAVMADTIGDADDVFDEEGTSFQFPDSVPADVHRLSHSGATGDGSTTAQDAQGNLSTVTRSSTAQAASADPCQVTNPNRAGYVAYAPDRKYREKVKSNGTIEYIYDTTFFTAMQSQGASYPNPNGGGPITTRRFFACAVGLARPVDVDHRRVQHYAQKLMYLDPTATILARTWGTDNDGSTLSINFGLSGGPLTASVSVPIHVGGIRNGGTGPYFLPRRWTMSRWNEVFGFWAAKGSPSIYNQGQTTMAIWEARSDRSVYRIEGRHQAHFGMHCKPMPFSPCN